MTVTNEIAQIELGMLARLKTVADVGRAGFPAWLTLITLPDNWEAYIASDAVVRCPAAWTVFTGWDSTELSGDQLLVRGGTFGLMVAAENMRADEQARRHGGRDASAEPGSYQLLAAAVTALAGETLGLDCMMSPLEAGAATPVVPTVAPRDRMMSRFLLFFKCDFVMSLVGEAVDYDPAALLSLHANWDIPPFDTPMPIDRDPVEDGVQLPDDADADATDHLSLGEPQT